MRRVDVTLIVTLAGLLLSWGAAQGGVFSFVDLDPTPPELFGACLQDARDIYSFTECTSNAEIIDLKAFADCNEGRDCTRYGYNVPFYPEKLGLQLEDTYDELWERHKEDIKEYAHDAWEAVGCYLPAYPGVALDVLGYGQGDASLRYWSEALVTASYYLSAALWWGTPFPGLSDFSDEDSGRIFAPTFSLIPKPNQYAELAASTRDGIYYFQRPAFPDTQIPYEASEVRAGLPGLYEKEKLKEGLGVATVLEYSQFGHGSFFEVYGKRRVVDIFVVWVKSCVPTPQTSPVVAFAVPLLPKAETRWTGLAEGYPLATEVEGEPWMPDPSTAFEANTIEVAAERFRLNPQAPWLFPGQDPASVDLAAFDLTSPDIDPRISLEAFLLPRIPFARDRGIPQEVAEDAKSGGTPSAAEVGTAAARAAAGGGLSGLLNERASFADVLNCPPVIVGPAGSQPYPILSLDAERATRSANVNEAVQYLFKTSANHLFDEATRDAVEGFRRAYNLPETTAPWTWQISSGGFALPLNSPEDLTDLVSALGGSGSSGVLCLGDEGSEVAVLDRLLARAGYDASGSGLGFGDANVFTEATEANLRAFQRDRGLEPDGVTSPETWAALHAAGGERSDPAGYQPPVVGLPPGQPWPSSAPPPPAPPGDPNAPAATAGGAPAAGGEGAAGAVGEPAPPPDSQELAQEVLANPNIVLLSGAALGVSDGSDPLSNVQAAAKAQPAKRREFDGVASGETWLNPEMLEGLLKIGEYYKVEVRAVAGGVHPAGSPHYGGAAFAISAVDGVPVADLETVVAPGGGEANAPPSSINGEPVETILAPGGNDVEAPFTRQSNNPVLQIVALCELGEATRIASPLDGERRPDSIECAWPVADAP